jgi:type III secretion protein R
MIEEFPRIFPTVAGLFILSMLPFFVVVTTSFIKITIVFFLLRNAMGVQQAPTSFTLNSLALILTLFIISPVWMRVYDVAIENNLKFDTLQDAQDAYEILHVPVKQFLNKFAFEKEKTFFISAAKELWPKDMHGYLSSDSMIIIIPAFVVSEIGRAFQIGFLLFLPFAVVDMVVSNILLALGAMMVPPTLISLPAKLFLFVAADGWARIIHGLMISYI